MWCQPRRCWLQDACVCVCVCVCVTGSICSALSFCLSSLWCFPAAFRKQLSGRPDGFPGRTPLLLQFLLGDNGRSPTGAWRGCVFESVCVLMGGIYWGSSRLPFRKLQIYPSSREALLCVCCVFMSVGPKCLHKDKDMKEIFSTFLHGLKFRISSWFRINWDGSL